MRRMAVRVTADTHGIAAIGCCLEIFVLPFLMACLPLAVVYFICRMNERRKEKQNNNKNTPDENKYTSRVK